MPSRGLSYVREWHLIRSADTAGSVCTATSVHGHESRRPRIGEQPCIDGGNDLDSEGQVIQ